MLSHGTAIICVIGLCHKLTNLSGYLDKKSGTCCWKHVHIGKRKRKKSDHDLTRDIPWEETIFINGHKFGRMFFPCICKMHAYFFFENKPYFLCIVASTDSMPSLD